MSRLIYLENAKDDSAASAGFILMLFTILVTFSIISMIIFACGDPGKSTKSRGNGGIDGTGNGCFDGGGGGCGGGGCGGGG